MRLVHKQAINAQLLKGDNIIFAACFHQLLQPNFQTFLGFLQCLNREPFCTAGTHFFQTILNFPYLLLDQLLLPFHRYGDLLKLGVTHDNGIIIAGSNLGAEGLSPCRFKVFFTGNQNIGRGVQP